jgi:hypothetical protein
MNNPSQTSFTQHPSVGSRHGASQTPSDPGPSQTKDTDTEAQTLPTAAVCTLSLATIPTPLQLIFAYKECERTLSLSQNIHKSLCRNFQLGPRSRLPGCPINNYSMTTGRLRTSDTRGPNEAFAVMLVERGLGWVVHVPSELCC